jgi:NADPH:quinone reductase
MMRGLRFAEHGGPDVLSWDSVPEPVPAAGEVLVEVRAFAVNWADLLERAGKYPGAPEPPYVVGHDFAGVVVRQGSDGAGPDAGTRVFGVIPRGGVAAEYVAVPAAQIYRAPDRLTDEQAAGAAGPYLTADAAIVTLGRLEKGEDVLIHAATGAYGSAALQLCRAYGAGRIIATAGSDAKIARAREWGADVAVNYTTDDFVDVVREVTDGRGVSLVLESVGGDVLSQSLDCVRPAGRLVSVGASSGRSSDRFRLHTLFEKGISVAGFTLGKWLTESPELVRPSVERVLELFQRGAIEPVVARVFPADEVAAAHEFLANRKSIGRTVVVMPEHP